MSPPFLTLGYTAGGGFAVNDWPVWVGVSIMQVGMSAPCTAPIYRSRVCKQTLGGRKACIQYSRAGRQWSRLDYVISGKMRRNFEEISAAFIRSFKPRIRSALSRHAMPCHAISMPYYIRYILCSSKLAGFSRISYKVYSSSSRTVCVILRRARSHHFPHFPGDGPP